MSPAVVFVIVFLLIGAPVLALSLRSLQGSLERWDQERHAQD